MMITTFESVNLLLLACTCPCITGFLCIFFVLLLNEEEVLYKQIAAWAPICLYGEYIKNNNLIFNKNNFISF